MNKFRFVVVEYCFEDDSCFGSKNVLGAYETLGGARAAAGAYIKRNVKSKRKKYRDWKVDVRPELIYFPIRDI